MYHSSIALHFNVFMTYLGNRHLCLKATPSVAPMRALTRMAPASALLTVTTTAATRASSATLPKGNAPPLRAAVGGTVAVVRPAWMVTGTLLEITSVGHPAFTGTPGKAPRHTRPRPAEWWSSLRDFRRPFLRQASYLFYMHYCFL